jgi:hypothetical protein
METQPLDRDSEQTRREIEASMLNLRKQLSLAEWRIDLLELVGSDHEKGFRKMKQEIVNMYKSLGKDGDLRKRIKSIEQEVNAALKASSPSQEHAMQSIGRSTYSLDDIPTSTKRSIRREVQIHSYKTKNSNSNKILPRAMVAGWRNLERSLQQMDVRSDRFNGLKLGPQRVPEQTKRDTSNQRVAPSALMSPERTSSLSGPSLCSVSIFSPPSAAKARSGWDRPSTVERNRMHKSLSMDAPHDLKQTTLTEASRPTLSSIGSTPEKLQAIMELKSSDFSTSSTSQRSANTSASSAKKLASSAAYPPMSSKPPPPYPSTSAAQTSLTSTSASNEPSAEVLWGSKASAAFPPQSKVAPRAFSNTQPSEKSNDNTKSDESPTLSKENTSVMGFGDMMGLEAALTMPDGRKTQLLNQSSEGTKSSGILSTERSDNCGSAELDYKAILCAIIQNVAPEKLGAIDKNLQKYKVSCCEDVVGSSTMQHFLHSPKSGFLSTGS